MLYMDMHCMLCRTTWCASLRRQQLHSEGLGHLALCTRVSNTLTLTDPQTLRQVQMDVSPSSPPGHMPLWQT